MEKNLNIPAISVLMPVYNAEKYLCEAIDSILQQTFTDFEFLIIDDGSTDKSVDIIRSYSDKRIVLTTKPCNTGLIDTLNMGIQLARGKYIARMDADDISVAGRLKSQYQYMENNPDVLVVGSLYQCIGTDIVYDMPISCSQVKVYSM
ncbi:MAG TPA: glycosyltransferase family 2 protein, partial [Bacteroidia bacterium]